MVALRSINCYNVMFFRKVFMRKLFGTDGIRGLANTDPVSINISRRLAHAICKMFCTKTKHVLIGKDPRISGDVFTYALASEFASLGINVTLLGVVPTPALAILTPKFKASAGIMISASHNPYYDNGIKIFNALGLKLKDNEEIEIEKLIFDETSSCPAALEQEIGIIENGIELINLYTFDLISKFSSLKKTPLKIALDTANGSFSNIAKEVLEALGFLVISEHDSPDGFNINDKCGVTHPKTIISMTKKYNADFGVAFDGDGDRVLFCTPKGQILTGDHILAIVCEAENLRDTKIASTIMSNFGLEKYLNKRNIKLLKTNVGDRYISECIQRFPEIKFGGEPSGHIIMTEHSLTGDGLYTCLKVSSYLVNGNRTLEELYNVLKLCPSILKNIKVYDKNVIKEPQIINLINEFQSLLQGRGKIIVRSSGTESVIRILAEGDDVIFLKNIVKRLSETILKIDHENFIKS